MKKHLVFRFAAAIAVIISLLTGCSVQQSADPALDPKLHIDYYAELTALYGTERMATLEALGYKIEDTNVIHGFYIGIPVQVEYAGVVFDVYLGFDDDAMLSHVIYEKKYSYPGETDQAIRDTLAIGKQLAQELGEPAETDSWNDILEEEYKTEMDPDPPSYRSAEELQKIVGNSVGGGIAWWDMTVYANPAAREYNAQRFGDEGTCFFGLNFTANTKHDSEIIVTLSF